MYRLLALAAFVAAGCGARLGDEGGNNAVVDAGNGSGSNNNNGNADAALPKDAANAAACGNGRSVFLAFEGVSVTRATPSDATQNRISWMSNTSATVPPYHAGDANRAADIATIVAGVRSRLAATPITVVTQRPAAGPYVMVVFGGTNTNIGTPYTLATNEHDCGDVVKSDVAWVADSATVSYAQDLAVGAIGWGLGLNGTTDPNDCMCAWANNCESVLGACTLSASIASTTSLSPATTCPNQNPQNEVAAFSTGFCQ